MKSKFAATAAAMCLAIASTLAHADPTPTPNYTSPGIGTLVIHCYSARGDALARCELFAAGRSYLPPNSSLSIMQGRYINKRAARS